MKQFWTKDSKKASKINENGSPQERIFNDILGFCKKWQTAFGLRLRGRILCLGLLFSLFDHPLVPFVFSTFFCRLLGSPRDLIFTGRRWNLHPLIRIQEQSTCYLYLEPLLPLRHGDFYWQPGGPVPRARGRICSRMQLKGCRSSRRPVKMRSRGHPNYKQIDAKTKGSKAKPKE